MSNSVWPYGLPDSSVHGILQARLLEWVAMPYSRGSSWPRNRTRVFCITSRFFTVWGTREALEYWSGLPCPPPGDLLNPGIKPASLMSPTLAGELFTASATWEALNGRDFEQIPGDGEGQGSLVCCSLWGCKESDTTEQMNNSKS